MPAEASLFNTAARSDDGGVTFRSVCSSVASKSTDRPWYAIDGDPLRGGSVFLAITLIGADRACEGKTMHDVLAIARSPIARKPASAGIAFAPLERITAPCAMGGSGNAVVSPASHRVFVAHTNALTQDGRGHDEVRLARCDRVDFSVRRSGLACTDRLVARADHAFVGRNAAVAAVDRRGGLYVVWAQFPFGGKRPTGDIRLFVSASRDDGETWTQPVSIPTPGLRTNVFPWIDAGDPGRIDVAWYGTSATDPVRRLGCGGGADVQGSWGVYFTQSLNALTRKPIFTQPILVSEHSVHRGGISGEPGGKFCGNGVMGDFLELRVAPDGAAAVVYADSNNANGVQPGVNDPNAGQLAHPMFVRQNGGPSVYSSRPPVRGPRPTTNATRDPPADARFEAGGRISRSQANLDILASRISKLDLRHYRVTLTVADLRSLAPDPTTGNRDTHLVWLSQWLSPSRTEPVGGGNFFAYMESANGRRPTFWIGESGRATNDLGAPGFSYPGSTRVRGSYTATKPGRIMIDVPIRAARSPNPTSKTLYQVTASTMTQSADPHDPYLANGIGGSFFNLIDVAPSFDFVP